MERHKFDTVALAPYGQVVSGAGLRVFVHDKLTCAGSHCVIHSPSNHHMRDWPTCWRSDKGGVERTCPHGVGHPDPDDMAYQRRHGRDHLGTHGCDGCCQEVAS